MKSKIAFAIIGGIALAIIGLFIGMNIGGNYYTGFEFMGQVGYEGTGYLGALIGAVLGILIGILLASKFSHKNNI